MKKIIVIGDSVIKGIYCEPVTERYKLISDNDFSDQFGNEITVENKAVIGATLSKCEKILSRTDFSDAGNTTVLFSFGGNDANFKWSEISDNPCGTFLPATTENDYTEGYVNIIRSVRNLGVKTVMTNLAPIDSEKYFETISRKLSKENILKWLGAKSTLSRWHEHYSNLAEKISEAADCPLIDIRTPFLVSHDFQDLISADGIHPTPSGHKIIHREVGEYFKI